MCEKKAQMRLIVLNYGPDIVDKSVKKIAVLIQITFKDQQWLDPPCGIMGPRCQCIAFEL